MTPKEERIKSTCGFCYSGCGVLVTVTGGKVTKVAGDPPRARSIGAGCAPKDSLPRNNSIIRNVCVILCKEPTQEDRANGKKYPGTRLSIILPKHSKKPRNNTDRKAWPLCKEPPKA